VFRTFKWLPLPKGMSLGQYPIGKLIHTKDGKAWKVMSHSTQCLQVRSCYLWERLWWFVKKRRVERER